MRNFLVKGWGWLFGRGGWEIAFLALLILGVPLLTYYNLETNPRPWSDEGAYSGMAKGLVLDGVFGVPISDGYQFYGASLGPTVVLPVALSFKLFGVGLLQGRMVAATLSLLALAVFYSCGQLLFGRRAALIAVVLLLASPAVGFWLFGRPVGGEIPALGFFLAGWFAWAQGVRSNRRWPYILSGLLVGAAMVTKMHHLVTGVATLALLAGLDLFYYRQHKFWSLLVVGVIALGCAAAWWLWQVSYFGLATFQENAAQMAVVAASETGFNLQNVGDAIKSLIGSGSGYFFFYWGFPALIYGGLLCLPRTQASLIRAFLLVFVAVWLGYYTFGHIPWPRNMIPAPAIAALFVGKLCCDLAASLGSSGQVLWREVCQIGRGRPFFSAQALTSLGTLTALLTLGLLTGYQLQRTIRTDVLDKVGNESSLVLSPPQLDSPEQLVSFLNKNVAKDLVIETSERELNLLTQHKYHFPDTTLQARANAFRFRSGQWDYVLGADYFNRIRPAYVVVGWFTRYYQFYDMDFLAMHSKRVATIGSGDWRYDVYELHLP